ncbi:MAG: serine/threonine-protein kinase, partial [Candidatus Binatia bacterium]
MDSQPPRTIGRYRVVRTLGSGGMGTVYLAEDPALKRAVALKVVQGGLREQKQALARFRREAEISARLNHPNVITIHDVGEDPAVGPFITMEFIDGQSLAGVLRERTLPIEARLALLVQAARALHAAHEAGIVHRDVKPHNLMISRDGRVKLMDFGVARSDESTLTVTGAVLGTPAYLAPEQIDGVQPSVATDTYAFAVLAFEALCGQRPYTADTVSKLLYQIVHEPPAFPPGLDAHLRTVLERALAKSPASRFAGPKSFLEALIDASPTDASTRARLHAGLETEDPLAMRTGGAG